MFVMLVNLLSAYALVGILFAVAFVTTGVHAIDPVAKGSSVGFRLIIFSGAAALWPLLLMQWIRVGRRRA